MFGRGSRFPPSKPSEVPGPGTYDSQDPEFDAYKRGAFLEKQDRFIEPKVLEVPGPGTYNADHKLDGKTTVNKMRVPSGDRYAVLQRKVEELERVHAESKKSYQTEVERLKLELARAQKSNSESNERIEKLKKQGDAQDTRIQELKKTHLSDQSEIKDLRAKLRVSEHERTQLASKQGEAGEAKKAIHALEAKRKEEVREKERKIAELERTLAVGKKMRENVEAKLAETEGRVSSEVQEARATSQALQGELTSAMAEIGRARAALAALKGQAEDTEEDLLIELENYRVMLSSVAQEYGRLVSNTVSKAVHERVKHESLVLRLRVNKLERQSANSNGQVTELANIVRHTQDQNALLTAQLREVEEQLAYYASTLGSVLSQRETLAGDDIKLSMSLFNVGREFYEAEAVIRTSQQADDKIWGELDKLRRQQLLLHATCLLKHVDEAWSLVDQRDNEISAATRRATELANQLSTARADCGTAETQLVETTSLLAIARTTEELLKKQLEVAHAEKKAEATKTQKLVKQEKEANQRLAGLVQQSKATEQALNEELDRLITELAEAEQYREAYCNIIDEVDALVRKNALAEDEAQKLSKFNAEILGHNNPQQRIMYVDKIRQELHEFKQKLLMTTREKETVINENDQLRRELELYKSVAVSADVKPRTFVTRITRAPLANQNLNAMAGPNAQSHLSSSTAVKGMDLLPEVEYREGDMTLDELDIPP
ncbi:hypothetical protein BC835DRAFT_1280794 [Cytidiella melzeri]|nr:hypothetical protein BC835DRAFT_1280794 [Cytidiella melzeri]